jgi:membrane fusion protein (multidrug efflux system)
MLASSLITLACREDGSTSTGPPELPPLPVYTVVVEASDLPRMISSVGSLESPEMTTVASEIAGTIVEIAAGEGQSVAVGHVVLRLDDQEARATLKITDARLRNARNRLARIQQLFGNGVASQQQLDDASSNFDAADGAHHAARTRFAKHVLRAPYAGTLGMNQVDLGDYVEPGDAIVEISTTGALELRFALPQRHISEIAIGQTVSGLVGRCGPRFEGEVVAIDPRVDPRTRMVGVRAAIENAAGELHPGMAVRLRVLVGIHEGATLVPQEAIVRQGTKHILYIIGDDNVANPRNVEIGDYYMDGAHVVNGLEPGEQIVIAGQQKLRPGSKVVPSPDPDARKANPVTQVGRYGPIGCETP